MNTFDPKNCRYSSQWRSDNEVDPIYAATQEAKKSVYQSFSNVLKQGQETFNGNVRFEFKESREMAIEVGVTYGKSKNDFVYKSFLIKNGSVASQGSPATSMSGLISAVSSLIKK